MKDTVSEEQFSIIAKSKLIIVEQLIYWQIGINELTSVCKRWRDFLLHYSSFRWL